MTIYHRANCMKRFFAHLFARLRNRKLYRKPVFFFPTGLYIPSVVILPISPLRAAVTFNPHRNLIRVDDVVIISSRLKRAIHSLMWHLSVRDTANDISHLKLPILGKLLATRRDLSL